MDRLDLRPISLNNRIIYNTGVFGKKKREYRSAEMLSINSLCKIGDINLLPTQKKGVVGHLGTVI